MILLFAMGCIEGRAPVSTPVRFESVGVPEVRTDGTLELDALTVEVKHLRFESPPLEVTGFIGLPWFGSVAHAHPGHDFAGSIRGELLGSWELDLLSNTELGLADGWEGEVETGRFDLGRARLSGRWVSDAGTWPIDVEVDLDETVSNIDALTRFDPTSPQTMTLTFDSSVATGFFVFDDTDGDGSFTEADEAFLNTVVFGLASSASWAFVPSQEMSP